MALQDVYTALAGMTVTHNAVAIPGTLPSALPDSVQPANLPKRLLLAFSNRGNVHNVDYLQFKPRSYATWQVVDLYLYRKAPSDVGLRAHAGELVEYIDLYHAALGALNFGECFSLVYASYAPGVYEWGGVANQYYGVEVTITVEELM